MDSCLIMPNGNKLEGIKYYDVADAAMQIVNTRISEDENLKNKFNEFKKDYKHFEPYLDFLIIHMGYKFANPFLDSGILYGEDGELRYKMLPEKESEDYIVYPKSDDKSLGIDTFSVDNYCDSIISPDGIIYKLNRDNADNHQKFFEVILMHKMIYNKLLYEDYKNCVYNKKIINDKDVYSIFNSINSYFVNRLGYLQAVKYLENTGHIRYNSELKSGFVDGMLKGIYEMYPKVFSNVDHIPDEIIEESENMKSEMSDIYDGRRIRF